MMSARNPGEAAPSGPTTTEQTADQATKTVVITWVEESHHEAVVRVPLDFDADNRDLANGLAELSNDAYQWLERSLIEVRPTASNPAAEYFDPPVYPEGS